MKRSAKLLAMAVALAVLVGAWLLAESMAGRLTDKTESETAAAEEAAVIRLSAGTAEDIQSLRWDWESGSAALLWKEESDVWINAGDSACPIDQTAVEPLIAAAADVTAGMSITGVTDFAQYGLDEAAMTITVGTADHEVTYELGSQTIEGEYYLRVDGTDTVYTEKGTLLPAFEVTLEDILALETGPEDVASVTRLTVATDVSAWEMIYTEETADVWYGGAYNWFVTSGEETFPLEAANAGALYGHVTDITFLELVNWHGDAADYGLDAPQGTASVDYVTEDGEEKTFALEFGDYTGSYVYVRVADSDEIYIASGTALDGLMYPDWEAMMPMTVCPADLNVVAGATVALGGHIYELEIHRETTEITDESGETVTGETVCYTANGWTLDDELAFAWLESLTTLEAESLADTETGREELLTVTLRWEDETFPEVTVVLESYDSTRSLCMVNGAERYFIARTDGEELVLSAEELLIIE